MKGTRIRIRTLTAPLGTVMSSLAREHDRRVVGTVERAVEPTGWYEVSFPTLEKPVELHREMMEPILRN